MTGGMPGCNLMINYPRSAVSGGTHITHVLSIQRVIHSYHMNM